MSIKTDKAAQNHQKGYNCAQAVELPVHLLKKWESTNPSFSR